MNCLGDIGVCVEVEIIAAHIPDAASVFDFMPTGSVHIQLEDADPGALGNLAQHLTRGRGGAAHVNGGTGDGGVIGILAAGIAGRHGRQRGTGGGRGGEFGIGEIEIEDGGAFLSLRGHLLGAVLAQADAVAAAAMDKIVAIVGFFDRIKLIGRTALGKHRVAAALEQIGKGEGDGIGFGGLLAVNGDLNLDLEGAVGKERTGTSAAGMALGHGFAGEAAETGNGNIVYGGNIRTSLGFSLGQNQLFNQFGGVGIEIGAANRGGEEQRFPGGGYLGVVGILLDYVIGL